MKDFFSGYKRVIFFVALIAFFPAVVEFTIKISRDFETGFLNWRERIDS